MNELTLAVAILAWGVLPGAVVLSALRVDWSRVERIAAAPGLSLALVAAAAYLALALGLPTTPASVATVTAVFCGLVWLGLRGRVGRGPSGAGENGLPLSAFAPATPDWLPWLVLLLPAAIVLQLQPMYAGTILPPSLHDGLDHANWFRLIYETHSINPYTVLAPPLTPEGGPTLYPWGMHAWLALVAQTTTMDPVQVLMRGLVFISALLPLSVYAFTAHFTGRGWMAMTSAAFSLFFWWLPYQVWGWGGYALLAGAMAALPVSRLSLTAVDSGRPIAIGAAGACGIGLLFIHPSQAWLALVVAATVSVTLAAGRVTRWRNAAVFVAAVAVAGVAMTAGSALWDPASTFLERARQVGGAVADDTRGQWPLAAFFDLDVRLSPGSRVGLTLLLAAGAVVAFRHPALRPFLALAIVFSLLIPLAASRTWITSLWYHAPERIWFAQSAGRLPLAALGVAGVIELLAGPMTRWIDGRRWRAVAWPGLLAVCLVTTSRHYGDWVDRRLWEMAHQNRTFALTVLDQNILADADWIVRHIQPGEVIFNAPADWGLMLPLTGRRTVFWSGGQAFDPTTDWNYVFGLLAVDPTVAAHAVREIAARGISYVYAGALSARLRAGRDDFDRSTLRANPHLELVYESASALIFRIRPDGSRLLGLRDSDDVRFRGFADIEPYGAFDWRRTSDGRIVFQTPASAAGADECFIRVLGPTLGSYGLSISGRGMELTEEGHRVPRRDLERDAFEVTIRPTDSRDAGMGGPPALRVRNVSIRCPSRSGPGTAGSTTGTNQARGAVFSQ